MMLVKFGEFWMVGWHRTRTDDARTTKIGGDVDSRV